MHQSIKPVSQHTGTVEEEVLAPLLAEVARIDSRSRLLAMAQATTASPASTAAVVVVAAVAATCGSTATFTATEDAGEGKLEEEQEAGGRGGRWG